MLRRYDALVLQLLKTLRMAENAESLPAVDLRAQSAASGVDCTASLLSPLDGDGGGADE